MPLAGWLCERVGSRRVTVAALVAGERRRSFVASLAGGLGGLAAALFGFGAGFGAINVAANAQGLALERLYGRSILSSFHAAFSAGGACRRRPRRARGGAPAIEPRAHFGVARARRSCVVRSRGRPAAAAAGRRRRRPHADLRPPAARPARARRGGVLHAARRGSRGRLERRLPLGLARRDGGGGRARLHRLLARDGDEPHASATA